MTLNQKSNLKLLKNDLILLIIILLISSSLLLMFKLKKEEAGARAVISIDGKVYKEISLESDTELIVSTTLGTNVVTVKENEVYVSSADCPDKICVNHAHIHSKGETIVCLPHKMVITIEGKEDSEIDSVSE